VAILAADIALEQSERFDHIRKIEVPVHAVLKDPAALFARL
jgi:fructose-specific phosphotransferase system component IIB